MHKSIHTVPGDDSPQDDTEQDQPNGGVALESCLQPVDVGEEILSFSEGIYCVAPAEGKKPVSFFRTPKLEAMAFPVQFPTGENTWMKTDILNYHLAVILNQDFSLWIIVLLEIQITCSLHSL